MNRPGQLQKLIFAGAAVVLVVACGLPASVTTPLPVLATLPPTSLPPPVLPTATATPTLPTSPTAAPTSNPLQTATAADIPTPVPAATATEIALLSYYPCEIRGNADFVRQTQMALTLLWNRAPDAYLKVEKYVGVIAQDGRSGMWAYEKPPRYAVSDKTAFYSLTWYTSTIAHDTTHSELYHEYLAAHGAPVPDDAWTGIEVERFCIAYQLDVLRRIGGTKEEIDHLGYQTGTHCDADGDGDCDWDDYNLRDW